MLELGALLMHVDLQISASLVVNCQGVFIMSTGLRFQSPARVASNVCEVNMTYTRCLSRETVKTGCEAQFRDSRARLKTLTWSELFTILCRGVFNRRSFIAS